MTKKKVKTFVLDTNVILHDSSCIYHFEENDIVIPITVLEELDQFKKGNSSLNYHAREFLRNLDSLSGDLMFEKGAEIGNGHGKIMVKLEQEFHADLKLNFSPQKPDHHILNICYRLYKDTPSRQVILVSKDVNLRMKAKSVNLKAQDYTTDHVKDVSALYEGLRVEENISSEIIDKLYQKPFEIDAAELSLESGLFPNQFLILKNGRKSALGVYDTSLEKIRRIDKKLVYGIAPRNAEQIFAFDSLLNRDIKLVSLSGKAGTGKTLLTLAAGLENHRHYRQMFLARPVVPLSNKDIGYLPGDIKSKLDPYMQPLYDNLGVIQNQFDQTDKNHKRIKEYLESEKLVITPLSYIRGRSLVKIFFIVDEAQNLTPHEVKTIITRAGEGTKIVFTGDIFQIDHPYLDIHSNGLSYLIEKMHGQKIYSHITLKKGERSELAELASDLL